MCNSGYFPALCSTKDIQADRHSKKVEIKPEKNDQKQKEVYFRPYIFQPIQTHLEQNPLTVSGQFVYPAEAPEQKVEVYFSDFHSMKYQNGYTKKVLLKKDGLYGTVRVVSK